MSQYKVVNFDEKIGQLIVEFAAEIAPLAIDVPIKDGLYIVGDELDAYIQGFIPTWHIERQTIIGLGVQNKDVLKGLVEQTADVDVSENLTPEQLQAQENQKMWIELEFEKRVAKALVKFGIIESDPTAI